MKPPKRQTDQELDFNINDCNQAISAMPENPKFYQYLIERDACRLEIQNRQALRIFRRQIKENLFDHLATGPITRNRHNWVIVRAHHQTNRAAWRDAAWRIGVYNLYGI